MKAKQLSKTKLKARIAGKTSPNVAAALMLALKNPAWMKYAKLLSASARKYPSINLSEIDNHSSMGDTIFVPGKVLSAGELNKKVKICSFGISAPAKEKLKKTRSIWVYVLEEIKSNPKAEGLKVIQ
jgi:large subunit ribosomal protein L18e